MKRSSAVLLMIVLCGFGSVARAGEASIPRGALPAAVIDSLDSRYPGATILQLMREDGAGGVLYEAEMSLPGGRVDALFDSDGRMREEEAQISVSDLPKVVRLAIQRVVGGRGSIVRAERLTSGVEHQSVRFEILVSRRARRMEYVYSASGRLLETRPAR